MGGSETRRRQQRKQVFFVRHGQSAHNIDRAALDTPDNPLTQVGRDQAVRTLVCGQPAPLSGCIIQCVLAAVLTRATSAHAAGGEWRAAPCRAGLGRF
jgi:bisphosphoglycerate-dependent phosphoglycerate mutase